MRHLLTAGALLLAGTIGLAQTRAPARSVQDDVGMFSADAKTKANAEIARIQQQFKKDLVIETTHAPKRPDSVDKSDKVAINRFFDTWSEDRFKNQRINGVYVVIVPEAKIIRVLTGHETERQGLFTPRNSSEVFKKIQEKLSAGEKDGALVAATGYVMDAMQHNAGGRAAVTKAAPTAVTPGQENQGSPIMTYVLWGLGIIVVLWIVSAIFRGIGSMAGGGGGAPGYGGAPGGGGFGSGFLGGLFGAAAGMWAYNHFFGPSTPSAYGGNGGQGPTDVGGGASVTGGDYTEPGPKDTGGDWGADAGGGDAGGDWGGGGDAGGGDWGGGGGDW